MKPNKRESPIWLTIYADMMTNLALFFLAAFVLTRVDRDIQLRAGDSFKSMITGKAKQTVVRDVAQDIRSTSAYSKIEITEKKIKIILFEDILFDSGSSELNEKTRQALSKVAEILKKSNTTVIVEGHTDDVPIKKGSNWELSLARAVNVAEYFIRNEGLRRRRFMVAGYGEYKPIAPNTTAENRGKNRRIEITIVRYE